MNKQEYPRILVISNNSFSESSSNGRTLGNFFYGWPKNKIAQFCVSTVVPNYQVCNNYYLVTDKSALTGFLHFGKAKRCDIKANEGSEGNTVIGVSKVVKTPWLVILRHIVWSFKRWNSVTFQNWVNHFDPEVVIFMNSDATFILDMATDISIKRSIPLVMFNTEGFYFFNDNHYYPSRFLSCSLFKIYQIIYRKHFRKAMKRVVLSIHLNSMLKIDYEKEFPGNHIVLYTSSNLVSNSENLHLESPIFSYLGNFGFNRSKALIEIAEVLQSMNTDYKLDVYGTIPLPEIKKRFDACPGINYRGMLSYDEVIKVMYNSTILFHTESQEERFNESLRYGFSTKIADSISSGHPFLMYSPPDIAGAKYIKETGAAWHAKDREELKTCIDIILNKEQERKTVLNTACRIAGKNHDLQKNAATFHYEINNIILKQDE